MYLQRRNRILRKSPAIRKLVAETHLSPDDFIVPLFIDEGKNISTEIASMPGYYRRSLDLTVKEVKELWQMGLKSVLLFVKAKDETKDNTGKEALNPEGLMQRSIRTIREAVPDMVIMTDVALDPFSSYGSGKLWRRMAIPIQASWPTARNTLHHSMALSAMPLTVLPVSVTRKLTRWTQPTGLKR
jgi:delta-aminolevulinic acid dehydratase/porphobilinogen synthase